MATELKTNSWHRYMLYRSDAMGLMPFASREAKQEGIDAGKKFVAGAYADVWAKDTGLVQRVRQFLGGNFHWHERLAKVGSDLEVVQILMTMVRGGSVLVIPEDPPRGGSVGVSVPAPARRKTFHEEVMETMGLSAGPAWDYVDQYNAMVTRLHEVEAARKRIVDAVDVSDYADAPTPLGDVPPFEYGENTLSGDMEELAASTNNPRFAAKMLGYDQNTFGEILHKFKPELGLRPSDNVIWHDNGDVHFNGKFIANFHDWAN